MGRMIMIAGLCIVLCRLPAVDGAETGAAVSGFTVPRQTETSWSKAATRIRSDSLKTGFAILDSIRSSSTQDDRTAAREYLEIASRCFLPMIDGEHDSIPRMIPVLLPQTTFAYLGPEEVEPAQVGWSVQERLEKGRRESGFILSTSFALVPMPSLRFPGMKERSPASLSVAIDSQSSADTPPRRVPDPFARKAKMEMRIVVVPGKASFTIDEYVHSILGDAYDEVWRTADLARFGAVAIRCRERSVFRNGAGSYVAYVAFDANVSSAHAHMRLSPIGGAVGKEEIPARYLIAMRSSESVERKAERIFQNVIARFEDKGK